MSSPPPSDEPQKNQHRSPALSIPQSAHTSRIDYSCKSSRPHAHICMRQPSVSVSLCHISNSTTPFHSTLSINSSTSLRSTCGFLLGILLFLIICQHDRYLQECFLVSKMLSSRSHPFLSSTHIFPQVLPTQKAAHLPTSSTRSIFPSQLIPSICQLSV